MPVFKLINDLREDMQGNAPADTGVTRAQLQALEKETHQFPYELPSRVIELTDMEVVLECLIDDGYSKTFQTRGYPRAAFGSEMELSQGKLIMIVIASPDTGFKIDFEAGEKYGLTPEMFEVEGLFSWADDEVFAEYNQAFE